MTTQGHLERLRTIAHDAPGAAAWGALCATLGDMRGDAAQVGMDYVRDHTREWPASLKVAPIARPRDLAPIPVWWPLVHTLELSLAEFEATDLRALAGSPCLSQPKRLVLKHIPRTEEQLAPLLESPQWLNLTELECARHWSGDLVLHVLTRAPMMAQLTHLTLSSASITSEGTASLVKSSHAVRLHHLDLTHNKLDIASLQALAAAPHMKQLHTLRVGDNNAFGLAGLIALSEHLPHLAHLDMSRCGLGTDEAGWLARQPWLSQLTGLELRHNTIADEGLRALLDSPHLASLNQLDLGANALTAEAANLFKGTSGLTRLGLMGCALGDEGVALLLDGMDRVEHLDLEAAEIGDEGAEVIARSSTRLRHLDLRLNTIGPQGAEALANSPTLSGLTWLNLWSNPIGRKGRRALRRSEHIPREALRF